MRGNRNRLEREKNAPRSIPAYAGEPDPASRCCPSHKVYPRVCGGTPIISLSLLDSLGLSPRMRGNRPVWLLLDAIGGSIPAYAGEPRSPSMRPLRYSVYPRVCGGTNGFGATRRARKGLSPRMRGNQPDIPGVDDNRRSIPAYAGEPIGVSWGKDSVVVYPRVCGGTHPANPHPTAQLGLSPRMRGNHTRYGRVPPSAGSIPAYAGEPWGRSMPAMASGVYPRVCGGTAWNRAGIIGRAGLSPRMRGNHCNGQTWGRSIRSIPAYAGEPSRGRAVVFSHQVYPRVCGGTPVLPRQSRRDGGLSPRMRGNHHALPFRILIQRSIPAYAGEPSRSSSATVSAQVYPRVCGGTDHYLATRPHRRGLSPRMRGNRLGLVKSHNISRSIPAYAGEPSTAPPPGDFPVVYPRVCGGTHIVGHRHCHFSGLSPRMRGNPTPCLYRNKGLGSIPAYAGEPRLSPPAPTPRRVYPRVCGGTRGGPALAVRRAGLSPRMRGNRRNGNRNRRRRRSIPAYAGEPRPAAESVPRATVYPRVCGGTGK